jgi:hypothetical protein
MSTTAEIIAFMATDFPQCNSTIEEIGQQCATVRHKIGRTLIVGDVNLFSEGDELPVAHAAGTYSVPSIK